MKFNDVPRLPENRGWLSGGVHRSTYCTKFLQANCRLITSRVRSSTGRNNPERTGNSSRLAHISNFLRGSIHSLNTNNEIRMARFSRTCIDR